MSPPRRRPDRHVDTAPSSLAVMEQHVSDSLEPTGIAMVDEVVREMERVSDQPVADHVQVFERAHEQLRRALDAVPEVESQPEQSL